MEGLAKAQALYDRRIPSDPRPKPEAEREQELAEEQDRTAIRATSIAEGIAAKKANPGRIVIVSSIKFIDLPKTRVEATAGAETRSPVSAGSGN